MGSKLDPKIEIASITDLSQSRVLSNFERLGEDFSKRGWTRDPIFRSIFQGLTTDINTGIWLEIGAGTGEFTRLIYQPDVKVIGIDCSNAMLRAARKLSAPLIGLCADAHSLPLGNEICDLVYSRNVLKHCNDPMQVVKEMARVCKFDGRIMIVESCAANNEDRAFIDSLISVAEPGQSGSLLASEWCTLLEGAGLVIENQRIFNHQVVASTRYLTEQFGISAEMMPYYLNLFASASPSLRETKQIRVSRDSSIAFLMCWTAVLASKK